MNKEKFREFYDDIYQDDIYASERYANAAIPSLKTFVEEYGLQDSVILDVGCGRGWFKDIVKDWIGLDISVAAGRVNSKCFVCGSAENVPLADESVNAIWSITFLEHSPQPEMALLEMARVLKKGGALFLAPAWRVPPWRPKGYEVKNYKDLVLMDKLFKLFLPMLNILWAKGVFWIPIRVIRELLWIIKRKPLKLFFVHFDPNLEEFLLPDSDACNSIDQHEALIWFLSRGFKQTQPTTMLSRILMRSGPIIISRPNA